MRRFIPGHVRGAVLFLLLLLNLFFWVAFLLPFAIVKIAAPIKIVRIPSDFILNFICTRWANCNRILFQVFLDVKWDIEGDDNLSMKKWYLVLSNHQSWADIPVLQYILNNRIPYFRFFLKKELMWIPIFNFVWLALDYPFMKRYSKTFLEKNPHLKGKDIETTRKSCEKFRDIPVSVMNFVEGTRFTSEKHKRQQSPFNHLLRPKAGGVAFVLSAMGEQLSEILDVTIAYQPKALGLWKFFCGEIKEIKVRVRHIPITPEILGDYLEDERYQKSFQNWVNTLWLEKDITFKELKN
ncbi:acyltransferase [bacterium]|nr:acyltransferase [bacterium]